MHTLVVLTQWTVARLKALRPDAGWPVLGREWKNDFPFQALGSGVKVELELVLDGERAGCSLSLVPYQRQPFDLAEFTKVKRLSPSPYHLTSESEHLNNLCSSDEKHAMHMQRRYRNRAKELSRTQSAETGFHS